MNDSTTRPPGAPYADLLLSIRHRTVQQLLAVAADEVQRREQFVLLAEQRLAYSIVMHEVERARSADSKAIVIVTGGPGSGKSVIALSLLGELARRGRTVLHATGSRSFTQTLRKVAGARAPRVQRMFKYFNQFMDAERNGLDVLILDEAHRIRETSVDRYTRAALPHWTATDRRAPLPRPVSPCSCSTNTRSSVPASSEPSQRSNAHAATMGLPVHRIDLDGQFRCGGSEEYVEWVLRLLGLSPAEPVALEGGSGVPSDCCRLPLRDGAPP